MPPKAKFSKEEVVAAALDIVREHGKEALTARELGAKLKSSARPVFTLFTGMEEVLAETVRAARDLYNRYVAEGLREEIAFRGVGKAYIRFAANEPQLFRLLFMREANAQAASALPEIDENYRAILQSITDRYGVGAAQAEELYRHLWIYSHGIATLLATRTCAFGEEQINAALGEVFLALLKEKTSEASK